MSDDETIRLVLLVLGIVFIPFALYRRLRSFTNEPLDRWQEGVFILIGLRLMGLVTFAGVIVWMINPTWMAWSSLPLPLWLRWIGIGFTALAGALLVWTFQSLGKNLTDTVVTRREHSLVTSGPYRWVRHPLYLACGLGVVGGSVATANWFFAIVGTIVLTLLVRRTRIEEARLVERFGDEYRNYMRHVGRFLPWIFR